MCACLVSCLPDSASTLWPQPVFHSEPIHLFNTYLLSAYYVPNAAPGPADVEVNNADVIPALGS